MDLDDILTKADAFDTEAATQGTSLGGEGFLASFAEIQDVKADDLAWDDIIPEEDRAKVEEEEKVQAAEATTRKRTSKVTTYDDGFESPASPPANKRGVPAPRKSNTQKTFDLKGRFSAYHAVLIAERDLRVLIRGMQKWGDIRTRYDPIVSELYGQCSSSGQRSQIGKQESPYDRSNLRGYPCGGRRSSRPTQGEYTGPARTW